MNRSEGEDDRAPGRQWRRFLLLAVALVCLASFALSTPALAQSDNDTEAPTLADAQRGDDTTILVTVADDTDVDESTVTQSDFSLSPGLLGNATVNESGSNATVELTLANKVDADNVTVSLVGSIADSAGNTVSDGAVTVTGMDGRNPRLSDFSATRINGTHGRITVDTSERLSGLQLALGGANPGNLDERNFTETVRNDGTVRYERVHAFDEEGVTVLLLMEVVDDAGNSVGYNARREYLTDRTPPTASIDGPTDVTTGDTHTFASGASDNVGVESVTWRLGNDTTRTGKSVSYAFAEPGNRTLAVTVADGRNHTATARHNVTVVAGASKDGVSVTPVAANRTNATVSANRTANRVRIADAGGRLAGVDGITLESVTATPPANESLALQVSVASEARAFTTATDRRSVGSFTLDHPDDGTAANVTFAFAVERSQLRAVGLAPGDVSLYRHDGNWTELPTTVRWRGTDTVRFRAESPGLSTFAIGASGSFAGDDTETDGSGTNATAGDSETATDGSSAETTDAASGSVVVASARVADTSVTAGEYAVVEATVVNRGAETATGTVPLSANGSVRAERSVTVPADENRTLQFATRVDRTTEFAVDGTVAGVVTVEPADERPPTTNETPSTAAGDAATVTDRPGTTATGETDGGGLPNPLALWPGGIVGTAIAGLLGLVAVTYGVLKALAVYLGY